MRKGEEPVLYSLSFLRGAALRVLCYLRDGSLQGHRRSTKLVDSIPELGLSSAHDRFLDAPPCVYSTRKGPHLRAGPP